MGRKNKIGRIAVRTKWFDDQLEASLGMPSSAGMSHVAYTVGDRLPVQVVELGAGLSTRPWRLHLPATVHWFDVDRQDVLDAKEILLEKHGAEVDLMSPVRRSMSKNSMLESKIGSIDHHFEGVQYPLRCASRVGVAADLGHKGWTKSLMAAGFDPNRPTVWIAEGLLMYLEEEHVGELLEETRSISAPGSAFLTVSVSEQVIKEIKNPSSKKNKGLMKEWVFGCPEDPTEVCFFLFAFF
jgi:O-methyltransferase involved in polyketide biosynthesis